MKTFFTLLKTMFVLIALNINFIFPQTGTLKAKFVSNINSSEYMLEQISIRTNTDALVAYVTPNSSGEITYNLNAGTYRIWVPNNGNSTSWVYQMITNVVIESGVINDYYLTNPIQCTPKGTFTGQFYSILDPSVKMTKTVYFWPQPSGSAKSATPLADGTLTFNLAPGTYKLWVPSNGNDQDWVFQEITGITITSNGVNSYYFDNPILCTPRGRLKAVFNSLLDPNVKMTKQIHIVPQTGTSLYVTPNANGVLDTALIPGTYKLKITSSGYNDPDWVYQEILNVQVAAGVTNDTYYNSPIACTPKTIKIDNFGVQMLGSTARVPRGGSADFLFDLTNYYGIQKTINYTFEVKKNGLSLNPQVIQSGSLNLSSGSSNLYGIVNIASSAETGTYTLNYTITYTHVSGTDITVSGNQTFDVVLSNIGSGMSKSWGIQFDSDNITSTPDNFELFQNYPNPFNPETTIKYNIPYQTHVTLTIYNTLGQAVRELVNSNQNSGIKTVSWDGKDNSGRQLSSGIYIYKLNVGTKVLSKKMLFVK